MRSAYALLLVLLPAAVSFAQDSSSVLVRGARIRIWASAPRLGKHVASVLAYERDTVTLALETPSRRVLVAASNVTRIDVSRGTATRSWGALRGAAIGFAATTVTTLALGSVLDRRYPHPNCRDCVSWKVVLPVLAAVPATLIGGVAGATHPPEYWERVPVPAVASQRF